jgi:hypothetical protein
LDLDRFTADVNSLSAKMILGATGEVSERLNFVKFRLIELYKKNIVKINHSAMELVCAKHLIHYGYEVDVEKQLTEMLVCDVYATKGDGQAIVEIETGFIPPEHALDPISYYIARICSKIARYSKYANHFVLATPPVSILPIPPVFSLPPRVRRADNLKKVKLLCDKYYRNPPVEVSEILNSRLHMIYIINIDEGKVIETDVESYLDSLKGMAWLSKVDTDILNT